MILEILVICTIIYLIYILAIKSNFNSIDDEVNDFNYEIVNINNTTKPQIKLYNQIYNGHNIQPLNSHGELLFKKYNVTSVIREIYFEDVDIYLVQGTVEDGIKYFIINKTNQSKEIFYSEPEIIQKKTKDVVNEEEEEDKKNYYPKELQNKIDLYSEHFTNKKNILAEFSVDSKRIGN